MVDVLVVEFMILFAVIVVSAMGTIRVVAVADVENVGSSGPYDLEKNGYHQCASWMVCQS